MRKNKLVPGLILILIGVALLLGNRDIFGFNIFNLGFLIGNYWAAIFLIIPGLVFHYAYFSHGRKDPGLLVPGGILIILGVVCQLSMLFGIWHLLWPGFILAPAVGLFELYIFGNKDKGLLIPVSILGGLSLIFFLGYINDIFDRNLKAYIIPVVLIALGIFVITKGFARKTE